MLKRTVLFFIALVCLNVSAQAQVPISGLPSASSATGTEVVPIVQSSTTKKITINSLFTGRTLAGTTTVSGTLSGSLLDKAGAVYNAKAYGITCDGSTDDSSALQTLISTTIPASGAVIDFSGCTNRVAIASAINIGNGTSSAVSSRNNIVFRGANGRQLPHATLGITKTGFLWTGASGGTMFNIDGPIGGVRFEDLIFDCAAVADTAIDAMSAHGIVLDGVEVVFNKGTAILLDHYADGSSINSSLDDGANVPVLRNVDIRSTSNSAKGIVVGSTGNIAQLYGDRIQITLSGTSVVGIQLGYVDHAVFNQCVTSMTSGVGLKIKPISNALKAFPVDISFFSCSLKGDVSVDETALTGGNLWTPLGGRGVTFINFSTADGQTVPFSDPRFWGISDAQEFFGAWSLKSASGFSLKPHGTGSGNTSELRFLELAANGSHYVGFKSPDSLAGNTVYTLPTAFPDSDKVLQSSSAGVLSWVAAGAGSTLPVVDTQTLVKGSVDDTKLLRIEVDGLTTGTTRVWTAPDSNTTIPIISQVLTFTGPTAARTFTLPDANSTLATLAGAETFTNKTLTSPVLTTPQINDTSADHQYVFAVSELAADRTVTLPLLTGNDTFVFNDFAATLTNKTINGANNTLTVRAASDITGQLPLANGGTGANLSDPNADRILFWDDSAGQVTWLTLGTNLSITGTTLDASGGGASPGGANTQVQFNDSGSFGGDAQFTFNKTSGLTTITSDAADGAALAKFLPGSGASFVQINNNGTMVIDSDTGTGTNILQLKYAGTTRWTFGFNGDLNDNGSGLISMGSGLVNYAVAGGVAQIKTYNELHLLPGVLGGAGTKRISVISQNAADIPFQVKGAGSQSGNLQNWVNSSDTVLSGIDASGRFYAPTALTASTVGSAGGASALPATPTGYLLINVNGTQKKVPYYDN